MRYLIFSCLGPAHWSTTVTVTPECRPRDPMNGSSGSSMLAAAAHAQRRATAASEQDRMALIAFADGVQVRKVIAAAAAAAKLDRIIFFLIRVIVNGAVLFFLVQQVTLSLIHI